MTHGGGGGGGGNSGNATTSTNKNYSMAITAMGTSASANAGDDVTVNLTVYNEGDTPFISTTIIYLSLDDTYDIYDTMLTISMPGTSLAIGASVSDSVTVSIPSNLASGTYYILGYLPLSPDPSFRDINPANNTWANAINHQRHQLRTRYV